MTRTKTSVVEAGATVRTLLQLSTVGAVLVGLGVRLLTAGWMVVVYGIVLVLLALVHAVCLIQATRSVQDRTSPLVGWICASNAAFLVSYLLQWDANDVAEWLAILRFVELFAPGRVDVAPAWYPDVLRHWLVVLMPLVISWLLVWGQVRERRATVGR